MPFILPDALTEDRKWRGSMINCLEDFMPLTWRPRMGETRGAHADEAPIIANGRVRGALPALGQPKTPATIPHSDRLGKEFRHRSFQAGGQPAGTQVGSRSRCPWVTVGDRSGSSIARFRGASLRLVLQSAQPDQRQRVHMPG
jgi:hypothetical protein